MKKTILAIALYLATGYSLAGSMVENVTIKVIGYDKGIPDVVFIRTTQAPATQTRIGCHTDTNWNYVLKLSTDLENKMHAALLAAQASKQNLTLKGSGLCDASYRAIESLHVVYTGTF